MIRPSTRPRSDEGFTLIELLVVIIVLSILLAIAVPSYLSFKDRANKVAAGSNVRSLIASVESYDTDNVPSGPNDPDLPNATDTGYQNMTMAELKADYDQALPTTDWVNPNDPNVPNGVVLPAPTANAYCAVSASGNWFAYKLGPAGVIKTTSDPTTVCT